MNSIFINELYYGNIDAQRSNLNQKRIFRKKMDILAESEKYLLENLGREELATFERFSDAWSFVNNESTRDAFRNGFKLGVKCATDVFYE